ncbi:MAG: glycosyltransferase family 39 protein [Candidatus Levybacteria bacterium]|nr:glycosyltransferase family 39 protein [Candidatus Levybacteria bacterium]
MKNFLKNKETLIIILLILIGGFLRFYNLNWGAPFYFHPDERNIASAASQLNFPLQMNPHFFAYGNFPIYLNYFSTIIINVIFSLKPITQASFEESIIIGRFYSALLSLLIIPLIYITGKTLKDKKTGIFSAFLATFSIGLIQFAHFSTFETWITFLSLVIFYLSLLFLNSGNKKLLLIIGIIFGLLLSTKISGGFIFLYILFLVLINNLKNRLKPLPLIKGLIVDSLIVFIPAIIILFLTSPFAFLDFGSFLSSLKYESSVALGTLPVFYTGEFFNSAPIIFQFTKIYPFLLNPALTIVFIFSFFYLILKGIKTKNPQYLILNTCYLILFLPQAFLFAKWTRYMMPTLPFIYLIISLSITNLLEVKINAIRIFFKIIFLILGMSTIIFAFSYFKTAFMSGDARISAVNFAKQNIPSSALIVSEVYDLGILPFNSFFPNITLFNFYDLEQPDNNKLGELYSLFHKTDYIILPSQRIMKTRLLNKQKFKNGNEFYSLLFNNKLGYRKVYETPCDIFCKITYLGNPVSSLEETANVFDRPTVFIFKKMKND